jgi:hypothetical protein
VEELVKGADEIWALSEPGSSQQRALATDKPSEHVAASPPLLKAPHMRAAEMGHCRAIKQDQRRSFTVFPGQAPKAGNALVRTPSATFQSWSCEFDSRHPLHSKIPSPR